MMHASPFGAAKRGTSMLEVLVAVTILALSGIGMITHVAQVMHSVRVMDQRDRYTRTASAELHKAQLWTDSDFAARVGRSRVPCCFMEVLPISSAQYRIVLSDTATGVPLLETSIYAQSVRR